MNPHCILLPALACVLGISAQAQAEPATTQLDERFSTSDRTSQHLPESAAWFVSEADGFSKSGKGLTITPNRHALAYFSESGQPITLKAGESLDVELTFSVRDPEKKGGVFRIGLLDSGGKRIAEDGAGAANAVFREYKGYAAFLDFDAPTAMSLYRRKGELSDKLISGNEAYGEALIRGGGKGGKFEGNTDYTVKFRVTRTSGGLEISGQVPEFDGYETKTVDTDDPVSSFDALVIYGARSGMSRFTLEQVKITN